MTPDHETDFELPVVADHELRLTSLLTPEERAELLRLCIVATDHAPEPSVATLAPVEFSDELFRDELEQAQARHLQSAERVRFERATRPPSQRQIEDTAAPLGRRLQTLIADYVSDCGPITIREVDSTE
jgi:hypothetical protein